MAAIWEPSASPDHPEGMAAAGKCCRSSRTPKEWRSRSGKPGDKRLVLREIGHQRTKKGHSFCLSIFFSLQHTHHTDIAKRDRTIKDRTMECNKTFIPQQRFY